MGSWGTFSNPIVGALGKLIRSAIQSANYVAGVAGWRISQDGEAEFADAVIRGELFVTGADDSYISIEKTDGLTDLPYMRWFPRNPAGYPNRISAYGFADEFVAGDADQVMGLTLGSPSVGSTANSAHIKLVSTGQTSGDPARIQLSADPFRAFGSDLMPLFYGQCGNEPINVPASGAGSPASVTKAVVFPQAFPVGVTPLVFCNIGTPTGSTRFLMVRGMNATNTGFTIWVTLTDPNGFVVALTNNVPIHWMAIAPQP
jgi:hypothetical protein